MSEAVPSSSSSCHETWTQSADGNLSDKFLHPSDVSVKSISTTATEAADPEDIFQLQNIRQRRIVQSAAMASSTAPSTQSRFQAVATPSAPTKASTSNSSMAGDSSSSDDKVRTSLDKGVERVKRWMKTRPQYNSGNQQSSATIHSQPQEYGALQEDLFMSILDDYRAEEKVRARTHSESDVARIRGLAHDVRPRSSTEYAYPSPHTSKIKQLHAPSAAQLSSSAAAALDTTNEEHSLFENNLLTYHDHVTADSPLPSRATSEPELQQQLHAFGDSMEGISPQSHTAPTVEAMPVVPELAPLPQPPTLPHNIEREREARRRWMRINHRFQLIIAAVALVFSLLIFCIVVSWAVWVIVYFFSLSKPCDLPLSAYFWLATIQLFVDIFRSDILRFCLGWDPTSGERIPFRIIFYNICYLIYAALVLRLGIMSIYMDSGATCPTTSREMFRASAAFVSLSLAAWATIIFGYVIPMLVAAAMLTYNGYNPSSHPASGETATTQTVLPSVYATGGAPSGCIEQIPVVNWSEIQARFPQDRECCICMEVFAQNDCIVKTACDHVFHKSCCKEWLRQARTCPVCRTDIPAATTSLDGDSARGQSQARIPFGPTGRPMAGMMRMFSRSEGDTDNEPQPRIEMERAPGEVQPVRPMDIESAEDGLSNGNACNL